ncbi:hypothetical protein [Clostridium sp. ZBS18]|uniref:hypothetical protein n=1 Tax=Clostridium sp. ZBS18 TaxID=2949967 RepID=UPI00207AEC14|nr:hypothetical protein [Clostridium sp. ZBS18]
MNNLNKKVIVGGVVPVVGTMILNYVRCCGCNVPHNDIHINLIITGGLIRLEQKEFMCMSCKTKNIITNDEFIDTSNFSIISLNLE